MLMNNHLVILLKGFNIGTHVSALNAKTLALASALAATGAKVVTISGSSSAQEPILLRNIHAGLHLSLRTTSLPHQSCQSIIGNRHRLSATFRLLSLVRQFKTRFKSEKVSIIFDDNQFSVLLVRLFSWIFSWQLVFDLEELPVREGMNSFLRIKQRTIFAIFVYLSDSCVVITSYLANKIRSIRPGLPVLVLPALTHDLSGTSHTVTSNKSTYDILYCGSAQYNDQLDAVIEGFNVHHANYSISERSPHLPPRLILIIPGLNPSLCYSITTRYPALDKSNLLLLCNLSPADYRSWLLCADALICPIPRSDSNSARFPQKLAEYASASGLILVSPVGDIPQYFKDNINSIYLNSLNPMDIANTIQKSRTLSADKILSLKSSARLCYEHHFSCHAQAKYLSRHLSK